MKPVKVFLNGKRLKDIYPHATPWQVFKYKVYVFFRAMFRLAIILGIAFGLFMAGRYLYPTQVYTKQEVIKEVKSFPPVLHRIAHAESYDSQFCTKEIVAKKGCHSYEIGAVLIHINKNGTYDIGRYAINSIHLSDAISRGYDVYKEKDNEQYGIYLFENFGSEPWNSSSKNW